MADTFDPLKGFVHRLRAVARNKATEASGLRVVRDARNAKLDIVAVHGLCGQGFRSWITRDPKTGVSKPWLQELLGIDMPEARILTYSYVSEGPSHGYVARNILYGRGTNLAGALAAQRQKDGTNGRPLFFIAHSLGGWIVQRALITASEATDPRLKELELSTSGILFLGTLSPSGLPSPTSLAHVIQMTAPGLENSREPSPSPPSQGLCTDDMTWLEHQMAAYRAISLNLPQLSFFESEKSENGFIVGQSQSMVGSDGIQVEMHATHSGLVSFCGRDDNYQIFLARFRKMVDQGSALSSIVAKRRASELQLDYLSLGYAIPSRLPNGLYPVVDRQDLLDQLEHLLYPDGKTPTADFDIVNLWGAAGAGKSTLAMHYAELRCARYSFVFWIQAESWYTAVASYLELANAIVKFYTGEIPRSQVEKDMGLIGIEDMLKVTSLMQLNISRVRSMIRAVKDWLMRSGNKDWLLIYDNVEPSYDILEFIPITLQGKIILTSRDSNLCPWGMKLLVDGMGEEQAVELLEIVLGSGGPIAPDQVHAASALVQQLSYHPQSITMVAATIRNKGLTVSEYLSLVADQSPLALVGSTIHQSPVTKTVLRVSSMLSPSSIPVTLLSASSHVKQAPERFKAILGDMRMFQNQEHLDDVLQYLLDQNFIQTPATPSDTASSFSFSSPSSSPSSQTSTSFDCFVVDSKAREHVRACLTDEEKIEHAWMACNVCANSITSQENQATTLPEIHDFGRIIGPHASACYDDWARVLEAAHEDDDIAWHLLGKICMAQGALDQAIGCFELSLRHQARTNSTECAETSLSLASLLAKTGQLEKCSQVLNDIDLGSVDQLWKFRIALAKASVLSAQGDLESAENQYQALELQQEATVGPVDETTVDAVRHLAATMEELGKLEEAEALYRRVYVTYLNTYGQHDSMTLDVLDKIADICKESHDTDKAEKLYKQSVGIRAQALGAHHPETALAIQNLAIIDDVRQQYPEAKLKYQQALNIISPSLGRAHPLYTTIMENMALSCRRRANSLTDQPTSRPSSFRALSSSLSSSRSRSRSRKARARQREDRDESVSQEATRQREFDEAERSYIDVLRIKQSSRGLYSEEQTMETASKLAEMYQNEAFFEHTRAEKMDSLRAVLREGRRRGTV